MIYKLKIYDNYHYQNESETWIKGEYETYEEALKEAKKMVEEDIEHYYKAEMSAEELTGAFRSFGDDPIIISEPSGVGGGFSAWSYAEEYAEIFVNLKKKIKKREDDLRSLSAICQSGTIGGYCTALYFDYFIKAYPWHFFKSAMKFGTFEKRREEIQKYTKDKVEHFNEFVMDTPMSEEEKSRMNIFMNEYKKIVKRELNKFK